MCISVEWIPESGIAGSLNMRLFPFSEVPGVYGSSAIPHPHQPWYFSSFIVDVFPR